MAGHIVAFGELLVRLTPPGNRLLLQADTLDVAVGGAEANVAAGLASLGHAVRFAGLVPDNPLGQRARAALGAAGVDTQFLATGSGRMGLYFLEAGSGPRPSVVTYDRAGSAFGEAAADAIDLAGALEGARLLVMSGITPALGANGVKLAQHAVRAAAAASVPICFDGNYRARLWEARDGAPGPILKPLVAQASILIGNHRDIARLLGAEFPGDDEERRREASAAAFDAFPALELIASTARRVVSSAHHRVAARVDSRHGGHQTEEIDVTGIIERIGTGDAFAAGVLHAWLGGGDERAMAQTGLALTALKHTLPGDLCLIGPQDLAAFSAEGGDVRR